MTYTQTSYLGLSLPVPGSGQAFETAVVNDNFQRILDRLQAVDLASAAGTVTASGFTLPSGGTITQADATDAPTRAQRTGRAGIWYINLNVGTNGLAVGGIICVVPDGYKPVSYTPGQLEVLTGASVYQSAIKVEVDKFGTMYVKQGTVPANYKVHGAIPFIVA